MTDTVKTTTPGDSSEAYRGVLRRNAPATARGTASVAGALLHLEPARGTAVVPPAPAPTVRARAVVQASTVVPPPAAPATTRRLWTWRPTIGHVGVPATAPARLSISVLSLLTLIVGLIGVASGFGVLRTVGLAGWLLFGLGAAPFALSKRMPLSTRITMSVLASLSGLVLGSLAMLELRWWHPLLLATVAGAPAAGMHIAGAVAAGRETLPLLRAWNVAHPGWARARAVPPALLLSVSGAAICLAAALTHRHLQPGLWGFLVQIGPWWYVGLALILASLLVSRSTGEIALAVGVLLVMLVLTGTPALVYDGPRSQSASKHLEFVEQIRLFHEMRSTIAVYNGWPGYFSAMAWLCDVTGIRDPLGLSTAWPVLIGLARVAAMRFLAGQVLRKPIQAWAAVLLGVLADPIGADYFSPQSIGFVFGLIAFGLALSHLRTWPKALAMTAAGAAITVSHQLSPFLVGGALCVLVLFRVSRPWWLPATILGPSVVWALLHLGDVQNFLSLGDVGNASNFRPPETIATPGLERLPVVGQTVVALVAGVVLVGLVALAVLVRRRRDRLAWAMAVCPAVGLAIIAVNPYGNEGIFRAILFGLPWLSILAASAVRPAPIGVHIRGRLLRVVHVPLLALCVALTLTFTVAAFGLDATNVLRPQDREAFEMFRATNPGSAATSYLLVAGPGDLPSSPPTQQLQHVAIKRSDIDPTGFALNVGTPADRVRDLTAMYLDYSGGAEKGSHLYAIWSPVSSYYGWEYGLHTPAQFAELRDAFAASPSWTTIYAEGGTVLFEYVPAGAR